MHEAPIFTHNLIDKRDAEWHFHYGFASSRRPGRNKGRPVT